MSRERLHFQISLQTLNLCSRNFAGRLAKTLGFGSTNLSPSHEGKEQFPSIPAKDPRKIKNRENNRTEPNTKEPQVSRAPQPWEFKKWIQNQERFHSNKIGLQRSPNTPTLYMFLGEEKTHAQELSTSQLTALTTQLEHTQELHAHYPLH